MNIIKVAPITDDLGKTKYLKQKYWLNIFAWTTTIGSLFCLLIGLAMIYLSVRDDMRSYLIPGIICLVLFVLLVLCAFFCWARWKNIRKNIEQYSNSKQNNIRD
ncbi:MAG: hypothetical protein LBS76_00365 [Mycoplasmataceae bacterium]|jgi:membrane-anchored glycerophosphoryl diester phosphodiesterase (GDPDase)|nr:hypothetical protein [Mycoplasmataceae bacterium]